MSCTSARSGLPTNGGQTAGSDTTRVAGEPGIDTWLAPQAAASASVAWLGTTSSLNDSKEQQALAGRGGPASARPSPGSSTVWSKFNDIWARTGSVSGWSTVMP